MRLIDADALREIYEEWISQLSASDDEGDKRGVETCMHALDDAPSIDAEPVRHGHWTQMLVSSGRPSWQCSVCGRRARGKRENLPYCHCGAKMDWEEKGDEQKCMN